MKIAYLKMSSQAKKASRTRDDPSTSSLISNSKEDDDDFLHTLIQGSHEVDPPNKTENQAFHIDKELDQEIQLFNELFFDELDCDPSNFSSFSQFWKFYGAKLPRLKKFACILFNIPASSA